MGRNFVFGCVSFFSLFSTQNQVTTNNRRTELSDISDKRPFSRDSNHTKNFFKFFFSGVEKNRFEFFVLSF